MKIIKKSNKKNPRISFILLDWGVRESLHFIDYMKKQTISNDQYEIIWVEYYSNVSEPVLKYEKDIDTLILLENSNNCIFHKHVMYNIGILFSQGEFVVICDSDAMVKPTFVASIIDAFDNNDQEVFIHLDQVRSYDKSLYPFSYPDFEVVESRQCHNFKNGKTTGISIERDILHNRNYGACFCARKDDLIKIGGSDEHVDYAGYICGPYDMSFRMINNGFKEIWLENEFLYHTWHPGDSGGLDYHGPHNGKRMSTTAINYIKTKQIYPHVFNSGIKKLMQNNIEVGELNDIDFLSPYLKMLNKLFLKTRKVRQLAREQYLVLEYCGFYVLKKESGYYSFSEKHIKHEINNLGSSPINAKNIIYFNENLEAVFKYIYRETFFARMVYITYIVQRILKRIFNFIRTIFIKIKKFSMSNSIGLNFFRILLTSKDKTVIMINSNLPSLFYRIKDRYNIGKNVQIIEINNQVEDFEAILKKMQQFENANFYIQEKLYLDYLSYFFKNKFDNINWL